MPALLTVTGLTRPGLQSTSFTLPAGKCLSVNGPSGAGKTLLLRALADLDPNHGELHLAGTARNDIPAPEWRRQVAYLPTESGWWAARVGEHFNDWDTALPFIRELGLTDDIRDHPVEHLSTGERQRLALARMLALSPRVLLLDEPTSALDRAMTAAVERLVREQLVQGAAALWVSHDPDQAQRVASGKLLVAAGTVTVES